jgi:di/tricarboxylate transporter
MTPEILGFLILFLAGLILFSAEWFSADVTALGLMLALIVTGMLPAEDAFAGFGSQTVLMILGLLILTETLIYTGMVDKTGRWILRVIGAEPGRLRLLMLIGPGVMSSFISNTAAAAFFLPVALGLSRRTQASASPLLMSLAFAAILASSVTLIGTSTNLVVSGLMEQYGLRPLSMFELTPVGLPILGGGLLYMHLLGQRLIPDRLGKASDDHLTRDDLYFSEVVIEPGAPAIGKTIENSAIMSALRLGVLRLQRGDEYLKPLANTVLQANDILLVEGLRDDILLINTTPGLKIKGMVEALGSYASEDEAQIAEVIILPGSPLLGRTIKGLRLRERYNLQILAIRQHGTFSYSKLGRRMLGLGDVLLVQMPRDNLHLLETERLFRTLDFIDAPSINGKNGTLAAAIFVGALALGVLGVFPLAVAVLLGALTVFLMRLIRPEDAYRNIEWKTLILIGSMLAFGQAMQATGTADYLAEQITHLPATDSAFMMLSLFFALAVILTQPMSNQAAAAVLVPIAIQTARQLDFNPRPFAIMIAIAASCSFITPLEPACVIIYNAGKFRFFDFVRVGGLLTLVVYAIAIVLVPLVWAV